MKTLTIIALLILSFVGYGQIYKTMKPEIKCSKCGNVIMMYKGLTTTKPLKLIYYCEKCGTTNKFLSIRDDTKFETFTEYPIFVSNKDTWKLNSEYFASTNSDYNLGIATFERGKFTICLDEFKVTDTIWIQAGKRKVGIPAFEFLKYFKDEPIVTWTNGSIFNR